MSIDTDLTRWNRAGLRRFRYIDGNAAEYLETLRFLLASQFPDWQKVQTLGSSGEADASGSDMDPENRESDRLSRVLAQYHDQRRDWAWEICRTFSRACHVLTEHVNACANESCLGTATQWDNVRKLVKMLDYHPAPPASAATRLVLMAKQGKQGLVKKGFQVKHKPSEGGPVIFETLEDITVDAALNALHLRQYNQSRSVISGTTLIVEGAHDDLNIGEPVVLEKETQDGSVGFSQARIISGLTLKKDQTVIRLSQAVSRKHGFIKGLTFIHLKPKEKPDIIGPCMSGDRNPAQPLEDSDFYLLRLADTPTALNAGDIVYITDTDQEFYRRVEKIKGRRIYINADIGPLDLKKAYLSRARHLPVVSIVDRDPATDTADIFIVKVTGDLSGLQQTKVADVQTIVTLSEGKISRQKEIPHFEVGNAAYTLPEEEGGGYTIIKLLDSKHHLKNPQALVVKPAAKEWRLDPYLKNDLNQPFETTLDIGIPKKTSAGDFAVVVSGNQYAWANVTSVSTDKEKNMAGLTVSRWYHRTGGRYYLKETVLYGHFKTSARLANWQNNTTPVYSNRLFMDTMPPALNPGKNLVLEKIKSGKVVESLDISISEIRQGLLIINRDLTGKGYTHHNTVIRGNVVSAGHGESKPPKVLGSGRATASNQVLPLKVSDISFVADATQTSGVKADIQVMVGDRTWEQVSSLNHSTPTDPHYVVRMTEDRFIAIGFGDGVHGRRLPSGNNNVRVSYRVGVGLSGNVAAGSLVKALKPHPMIASVDQPTGATGGNGMEDIESLRQSAPATLLTLERAVSLTDFANLAASHSSVWQARAFRRPGGRDLFERIEIVVVPANGTALGDLEKIIYAFVQTHAVPHVRVMITEFEKVWLDLTITVTIDKEAFDPDKVKKKISADLAGAFSLKKRQIGQSLYLGEVYSIVESIEGVIHSTCTIAVGGYTGTTPPSAIKGGGKNVKRIQPDKRQVVILDPDRSNIVIQ